MKNMIRISKNGVPTYVAPWYRDLTAAGKRMIGTNNIMAPYSSSRYGNGMRDNLTKVEYQHFYANGLPAHPDPKVREAVRQHEAEKAQAIAAYEAGLCAQKPEERMAA